MGADKLSLDVQTSMRAPSHAPSYASPEKDGRRDKVRMRRARWIASEPAEKREISQIVCQIERTPDVPTRPPLPGRTVTSVCVARASGEHVRTKVNATARSNWRAPGSGRRSNAEAARVSGGAVPRRPSGAQESHESSRPQMAGRPLASLGRRRDGPRMRHLRKAICTNARHARGRGK